MKTANKPFLVVRDDGYSEFCGPDTPCPMSAEEFLALNVDFLARFPDIKVKEMGIGPGCTFTFDTKTGDLPMTIASDTIKSRAREHDRQVVENVRYLIAVGKEPLRLAAERCHGMGIKLWARYEINHTYGPPAEDNVYWNVLMGRFDRDHPELRVGYDPVKCPEGIPSARMDFRHTAVRDFKLNIIRELLQRGIDGISIDFCVYPPFFSDPEKDGHWMTEFLRDVRAALDEEGKRTGRYIELIVRVDSMKAEEQGLDWRGWIREGLLDYIIPSVTVIAECWDVPNEEFVKTCEGTKCRVLTCVRPFVSNLVDTDPNPEDAKSGISRENTDQKLTKEAIYAKAFLGLKNGSGGIQVALGTGGLTDTRKIDPDSDDRRDGWRDVYGKLADMEYLRRQDKLYTFNQCQGLPATLTQEKPDAGYTIRIADRPEEIERVMLIVHARGLGATEKVELEINGHVMKLGPKELHLSIYEYPILARGDAAPYLLYRIPRWWDIGRNEIEIPVTWLREGQNSFRFRYADSEGNVAAGRSFRFGRMDLKVVMKPADNRQLS